MARPRTGPGPGDHLRRLRVPDQGPRRPRPRRRPALRALPPPLPAPLPPPPFNPAPTTRRSRRAVALPGSLRPFLERARSDQALRRSRTPAWQDLDLVIDRGDGAPLNPDTLSSRWRLFLKRSGLPHVRFHDLRHAHATLMLLQGVHPKVVSERLGHATVGITLDLYSHVLPSMQQDAVRAFDELFVT